MKKKNPHRADQYSCQDAKATNFNDRQFDYIVDKGTLDALMCCNEEAVDFLCEVHAALMTGGVYFIISLHPPELLVPFLSVQGIGFSIKASCIPTKVGKPRSVCVLRKNGPQSSRDVIHERQLEVLNKHFREDEPLLTSSRRAAIENEINDHAVETLVLGCVVHGSECAM